MNLRCANATIKEIVEFIALIYEQNIAAMTKSNEINITISHVPCNFKILHDWGMCVFYPTLNLNRIDPIARQNKFCSKYRPLIFREVKLISANLDFPFN